ncbi:MAG: dTDP-4-dehydrorhamnose reductase, partial [Candidatus Omnitrophota bacterium]
MVEENKVLITGAKGMFGSALVGVLSCDFAVKAIDIDDCDITDKARITKAIIDYKPYFVIHTAAYTDVDGSEQNPDRAFAVNAAGTENVARAADEIGAVLFYISTDYVFDGKNDKPYTETDTPNPINAYGRSKLEGERIIQSLLEKYFILRSSWLFGPGGKNFVSAILHKSGENKSLEVVNDQVGSPTYTLDLAKAIKSLLTTFYSLLSTNYGIYHITNRGSCSWYDFAREIVSIKRLNTRILPIDSVRGKRPANRPKMSILDNSKWTAAFKQGMRPWQEALTQFLWFLGDTPYQKQYFNSLSSSGLESNRVVPWGTSPREARGGLMRDKKHFYAVILAGGQGSRFWPLSRSLEP